MTALYGVYSATGISYTWCQTVAGNRIGLISKLGVFVHFNEHTIAHFLFEYMEKLIFGSPSAPITCPTSSRPTTHPL